MTRTFLNSSFNLLFQAQNINAAYWKKTVLFNNRKLTSPHSSPLNNLNHCTARQNHYQRLRYIHTSHSMFTVSFSALPIGSCGLSIRKPSGSFHETWREPQSREKSSPAVFQSCGRHSMMLNPSTFLQIKLHSMRIIEGIYQHCVFE